MITIRQDAILVMLNPPLRVVSQIRQTVCARRFLSKVCSHLQLSHPTLSQSIWRSGENPGKVPLKPNIGRSNVRFGSKADPSRALN
jgi:hypothetical protein